MKDTLLQEAIAEARQVRDAAIANAKIALEEALTPRLASVLSAKLRTEMEDSTKGDAHGVEDGGETDKKAVVEKVNPTSSDVGSGDNKEPSSDAKTSSNVPNPGLEVKPFGKGSSGADPKIGGKDPAPKGSDAHPETLHEDDILGSEEDEEDDELDIDVDAGGEEPEVDLDPSLGGDNGEDEFEPRRIPGARGPFGTEFGDEENGEEEEDDELDLESLLRELEAAILGQQQEVGMAEDLSQAAAGDNIEQTKEMEPHLSPEGEKETLKLSEEEKVQEEEGVDEEVDLDEILREMDVEAQGKDPQYYAKVAEQLQTENANLKRNLKEHRNVVKFLKNRINEINMVNAKLLYANKLFKNFDLNNTQKVRVIETFDRATSLREVKIVYTTLAEAYAGRTAAPTKRTRTITEGLASKVTGSTKPKTQQVITEETDTVKARFQKLAGILKG